MGGRGVSSPVGEHAPARRGEETVMNLALWIVAGLLAAALLVSTMKMYVPRETLAARGGAAAQWVLDFSPGALRAIGTLEILGAAGLILPAALDIAPVLV